MDARDTHVAVRGNSSGKAPRMSSERAFPKSGDVVVSRPTARADVYAFSVVPEEAKIVAIRYEEALQRVRELAKILAVDGWYTCDHTHFARIARHRDETRAM